MSISQCRHDNYYATVSVFGGGLISQKRKQAPSLFSFKVTKLCILLHAPIKTQQTMISATTRIHVEKKELMYNLSQFIIGGRDDASNGSNISLGDDNDVVDDEFDSAFTLSLFRKELMVLAGEQFLKEEYGLDNKIIGPKCKLFIQKQWNSSYWTKIPSAYIFVWTSKE